jgi:hypothetical protein
MLSKWHTGKCWSPVPTGKAASQWAHWKQLPIPSPRPPSGPFWIVLSPGIADLCLGSQGRGVESNAPLGLFVSVGSGTMCSACPEGRKKCLKGTSTLGSLLGKFWAAPNHQAGWLDAWPPASPGLRGPHLPGASPLQE